MVKVLDMRFIRYLNLFNKITGFSINHCFEYNNTIVFVVPRNLVMKAKGVNNINIKKLSKIIGKKVKIVAAPKSIEDLSRFASIITYPIKFNSISVKDGEAIISANIQNKASLIGREKARLLEMENILNQYFGIRKVKIK